MFSRRSAIALVFCTLWAAFASAQDAAVVITGPPAPLPPAVINRDAQGRATVRATRLTAPLKIDGHLDERAYEEVPSMTDFIQNDPSPGAPATQKTEVWVFFDDRAIYIVGKCWEDHLDKMIATEMRRDGAITQNDSFAWSFDTFYDHRNGVLFEVSPLGGRTDGGRERTNGQHQLESGLEAGGRSIRGRLDGRSGTAVQVAAFSSGAHADLGHSGAAENLWKNEISYLTPIPQEVLGQGHFRSSLDATLVGLEIASASKNLELKPYGTSNLTTDNTLSPAVTNDPGADFGIDAKYGVTQSLTADLTYNTDFSQVEADEQQVNLTRFNLFFPEKLEFFLENQGTFAFGGTLDANTPVLFHSRTIGLTEGRQVPIIGGGRLSGRVGRYEVGVLDIQTDDIAAVQSTNFQSARLKRDIFRKSSVGVIMTGRSVGLAGGDSRQSIGVDTTLAFYNNLVFDAYWAKTPNDTNGDDDSYRGRFEYAGDRYGVLAERLDIGAAFRPEVGFVEGPTSVATSDNSASVRVRARTLVRKYSYTGSLDYFENGAGAWTPATCSGSSASTFKTATRCA
jgi:hypothetical protein